MGKKIKELEFNGLGFPVMISNVEVKSSAFGDYYDIDFGALTNAAFRFLIEKPGSLTGAEVKFVRLTMGLTQNVFADLLRVDRSAVAKWEKNDLKESGMAKATEIFLRLKMAQREKRNLGKELAKIESATRKSTPKKPFEFTNRRRHAS